MVAPTSFFADYGCHVRILEEARILQRLGHDVTIVTYANGSNVAGLHIVRTLAIPWRRHYEVGSSRHKILFDALLGLRLLALTATRRYDVVHAHLHEGALLGLSLRWLHRVPVVFDFQGSMTEEMIDHHFLERGSRLYGLLRWLEKRLDRQSPLIFTSTTNARRLLIDEFGCNPRRVKTLEDSVDSDVFLPAERYAADDLLQLRRTLCLPDGHKVIVYLGLLAEYQGISHLLQAFRRVCDAHDDVTLLLMGFPGVDVYQAKARELGVAERVIFTGRIPYQDAPRYLALGDAAVAPKLSLTEGAGKVLNYMAVGLPTVAFDTPVAREYLGDDGLFALRGDVDSLARRLEEALYAPSSPARGQRLRRRAVACFDLQRTGRAIEDAYAELHRAHSPA